jgi:hypothetical protein
VLSSVVVIDNDSEDDSPTYSQTAAAPALELPVGLAYAAKVRMVPRLIIFNTTENSVLQSPMIAIAFDAMFPSYSS